VTAKSRENVDHRFLNVLKGAEVHERSRVAAAMRLGSAVSKTLNGKVKLEERVRLNT